MGQGWRVTRAGLSFLEMSRPGVFAAGVMGGGSIERVTAALGEGAMSVRLAHEYLTGDPSPISVPIGAVSAAAR